ncbi:MAG TPA: hypothetical protein VEK11_25535 [Thermoanaerobaculia bacterium]|nr:hypothetical protein [Thermoanaerobaculia bacterium]
MLHSLFALFVFTTTTPLFAAIELTHLSVDKARYDTGERVQVTMRVANTGTATVNDVQAQVYFGIASILVAADAPGWSCPTQLFTRCTRSAMGPGTESELRLTILAPPRTTDAPSLLTASAGPQTRQILVPVSNATNRADLTLKAIPSENPILPGKSGELTIVAENSGPDDAHEVHVELLTSPFTVIPQGWSCAQNASTGYSRCTRSVIPAHTSSSITLRFTAPQTEAFIDTFGRIQAELNRDDNANDVLSARVIVGDAEEWQRYLVPITLTRIPGANHSLWRTDMTMLFRGEEYPEVEPLPCGLPITCLYPTPPLHKPFDAHEHGYLGTYVGVGQFLHVRRGDVSDVAFNARFYDESRLQETAGTELPIVRVEKFHTGTFGLLDIPVAAQFRHTLRIYDGDGNDATVTIRIYADDETTPRLTTTRNLVAVDEPPTLTPHIPAYAELALAQLLPLDAFESVRVEIEPVTPGARIWAFVSITNNETHHVTLVTPQ